MTSKKLSNFQDPPPPVNLSPKFFHLLDFGLPISNEPSSPNDNQSLKRKHDRRMTIMLSTIFKGWLHCLTSEANISCQQYIYSAWYLVMAQIQFSLIKKYRLDIQNTRYTTTPRPVTSHLLKKSLMEKFIFCAMLWEHGLHQQILV